MPSLIRAQSTAAEAQEALSHVVHLSDNIDFDPAAALLQEKVVDVNRLDRNRGLSTQLAYRVVGAKDREAVHSLLYSAFYPDEPIISHLGLAKGIHSSIPDADRMVEAILSKNLSVIAENSKGEAVAVCVNNSCSGADVTEEILARELKEVQEEEYKPYVAIHHLLRLQSRHVYEEIGTDKFFSLRMVAVSRDERGQGLATDIIRRSVLLAGSLGFQGIKTEATGRWSKSAFSKIGLLPSSSIKYDEFEWQGKKALEGIKDDDEITFLRKKFFQSALKHIL